MMDDGAYRWPVVGGDCLLEIRGHRIAEMSFEFSRLADPDAPRSSPAYAKFNPAPIRVAVKKASDIRQRGLYEKVWIESEQLRISEVVNWFFSLSTIGSNGYLFLKNSGVTSQLVDQIARRFFDLRHMAQHLRGTGDESDLSERDRDFCQWLREVRVEPLMKARSKFTGWGDPNDYSRPYVIVTGPWSEYGDWTSQ